MLWLLEYVCHPQIRNKTEYLMDYCVRSNGWILETSLYSSYNLATYIYFISEIKQTFTYVGKSIFYLLEHSYTGIMVGYRKYRLKFTI